MPVKLPQKSFDPPDQWKQSRSDEGDSQASTFVTILFHWLLVVINMRCCQSTRWKNSCVVFFDSVWTLNNTNKYDKWQANYCWTVLLDFEPTYLSHLEATDPVAFDIPREQYDWSCCPVWRTTPDTNSGCGGTPPQHFCKLSTRRSRDFKINRPPNAVVSEPERNEFLRRRRTLERSGRAAQWKRLTNACGRRRRYRRYLNKEEINGRKSGIVSGAALMAMNLHS